MSAAVSPAAGTTITKVEFRRDGSNILIGTATAAPWQITWTNVSAGSYEVAAVAYDTAPNYTYSTPVPIQVGGPLVVQVASPAANSLIAAGSNVTITGSATRDGATAPITSMRFYR
ncbi:MAG: Ig-like domain-containing protein, partial [Planctomycetia bacterium]